METISSTASETIRQVRDLIIDSIISNSQNDFFTFLRTVAPTLIADFKMGRHIALIASKLQSVEEGKLKRLMVFLPPRSSKSLICSKLFPAWYMGRHPNH